MGGLLALGGCADYFVRDPPPSALRWRGTTTAGPAEIAGCGPLAVDVEIYQNPLYLQRHVHGWAEPPAEVAGWAARAADLTTTWSVAGHVSPANAVEFEVARQRPVYFRAKPYAVWRGNIAGDRATLTETGSPCGRELVLTRG